ncbi:MAG: hypothetical protein ACJ8GL_05610 [Bacillus sp. (in: firmicutes)]
MRKYVTIGYSERFTVPERNEKKENSLQRELVEATNARKEKNLDSW